MANYKKRKSRVCMGRGSHNDLKRRFKDDTSRWLWWMGTPRYWRLTQMTRPKRRLEKKLLHDILRGADADDIAWPVTKKPHWYYW